MADHRQFHWNCSGETPGQIASHNSWSPAAPVPTLATKHRSGTPTRHRKANCMSILRKFWRLAAVIVCAGAMFSGVATAAQASTANPGNHVIPRATVSVSPGNNCGGAKVNVEWSVENPFTHAGQIHIWGELWNNKCNFKDTYLFVSYDLVPGGSHQFFPIQSAYFNQLKNTGVDWYNHNSSKNYSGIEVRVCNTSTGGGCGTPIGV